MLWLYVTGVILQLGGLFNHTLMTVPAREIRAENQKALRDAEAE